MERRFATCPWFGRSPGTFLARLRSDARAVIFVGCQSHSASGEIIANCSDRQRHQAFLRFTKQVVAQVEPSMDVDFILGNSSVHKTPEVLKWLEKNHRVHFHFTPTSASWLNLVERYFGELTQRQIRRLAATSVGELEAAIQAYISYRNNNPKPFVWTASSQQIHEKVTKAKHTLATLHESALSAV
jgi:hypothetical protein